jgi:hypothetical protein
LLPLVYFDGYHVYDYELLSNFVKLCKAGKTPKPNEDVLDFMAQRATEEKVEQLSRSKHNLSVISRAKSPSKRSISYRSKSISPSKRSAEHGTASKQFFKHWSTRRTATKKDFSRISRAMGGSRKTLKKR